MGGCAVAWDKPWRCVERRRIDRGEAVRCVDHAAANLAEVVVVEVGSLGRVEICREGEKCTECECGRGKMEGILLSRNGSGFVLVVE
nr:hypothetical protein CFP56_54951 [Quercus suber]